MKNMEYEVYRSAVESYRNYPIYREWEIPDIDGNKGRPYRESMKGYYLISAKYPDYCIVGDILTSNKVWGNARERKNDDINHWLGVFERIYHCNGNYIPIPEIKDMRTANLAGNNCDTYTHHLNVYKDAIEEKLDVYPVWQRWVAEMWIPYCGEKSKAWERFIEEFYLTDYVEDSDGQMTPKCFVSGRAGINQVGIQKNDDDETLIKTIKNTIELLIKRCYRVEKKITGRFDFENTNEFKAYKKMMENSSISKF